MDASTLPHRPAAIDPSIGRAVGEDDRRRATLDAWLGEHRGLIHKVVRAWAFTAHDRDDLVQEIALRLWESIPRFEGQSAASTWVYRVALYSAMAWSRSKKRRDEREQQVEHPPLVEEADEDPRVEWLYAQIARLPDVDRSLALLLLEGWSYRDMAESLGISEKNVSVRIHRIKRALAERSPRGGGE